MGVFPEVQNLGPQIIESLKPQGRIGVIDEAPLLDAMLLRAKCLSLHWEGVFTRSGYGTPDEAEEGRILARIAALADAGTIKSTVREVMQGINAANPRQAHAQVTTGKGRGKLVLAGFY